MTPAPCLLVSNEDWSLWYWCRCVPVSAVRPPQPLDQMYSKWACRGAEARLQSTLSSLIHSDTADGPVWWKQLKYKLPLVSLHKSQTWHYILWKPSHMNNFLLSLQTNCIVLDENSLSRLADMSKPLSDKLHTGAAESRLAEWKKPNRTQQMVICMIYFRTFAEDIGGRGRFMQSWEFWNKRTRIQQAWRRQSDDLD